MIFSRTALLLSVAVLIVIVTVVLYVGGPRVPMWSGTAAPAAADSDRASSRTGSAASGLTSSPPESRAKSLAHSLKLPRSFDRTQRIERAAYDLGMENMAAALREVATTEDAADRATLLRGIFTAAAQLAPRDAIRWIKQVQEGANRELAMHALATAWRGGVPPRWQQGSRIEYAFGSALLDGTPPAVEAALAWAEELVTDRADYAALLGLAAQRFASSDAGRALALFNGLSADAERDMFRKAFGGGWTGMPPEEAWEAARQFPEGDLRNAAQTRILVAWARKDPAAAAGALGAIAAGSERPTGISTLAEIWASHDTHAALTWAATLPGEDRVHAETGISRAAPVGIGAVLDIANDGYPMVRELLADGPAGRSGKIPAGSLITAIADGTGNFLDTRNMELSKFVEKVRGPRGTRVTVFVQTPGATETTPVELVREQIVFKRDEK